MNDVRAAAAAGDLSFVPEDALADFVLPQRWFASKAREVVSVAVLDAVPLRREPPLLAAALVEARFQPGTHEVYQVPLGLRPAAEGWSLGVVAEADGWTVYDAFADPFHGRELLGLIRGSSSVRTEEAVSEFRWFEGYPALDGDVASVRPVTAEQSNSSVIYDDALVLKAYRRIEPGINPELELLRFLSEHEFPHIAPLAGWYQYSGRLMDTTLGVLQEYLPSGRDGWDIALDELAAGSAGLLDRLRALGEVTGELHATLGSDSSDPGFAPEEPSAEALSLLTATVDEEIEQIFLDLPDDGAVAPIAGRGEDVREQLRLMSQLGAAGRVIRTHGDYHLGQTLLSDRGWVVLDFEGEPARPIAERRRKRSPLRDVAGMMRSFAYAAAAAEFLRGAAAPPDWEARAREEFLAGYLDRVDQTLLPPGHDALERLLSVFELEKAVYELRYELNNRPNWVGIPATAIVRLLEAPPA